MTNLRIDFIDSIIVEHLLKLLECEGLEVIECGCIAPYPHYDFVALDPNFHDLVFIEVSIGKDGKPMWNRTNEEREFTCVEFLENNADMTELWEHTGYGIRYDRIMLEQKRGKIHHSWTRNLANNSGSSFIMSR